MIPDESPQYVRKLRFLEINGKAPALAGILNFLRQDQSDVTKLVRNIVLQLKSNQVLQSELKVQRGKGRGQEGIIEIKATRGHARLFAFFSPDDKLIIATHTFWKTSGGKRQDNEFDRAARLRSLFLDAYEKGTLIDEKSG